MVAKQGYDRAIEIKKEIKQLTARRDKYDVMYETRRYIKMIELVNPTAGEFDSAMFMENGDGNFRDDAKLEMDKLIESQRSKYGKSVSV